MLFSQCATMRDNDKSFEKENMDSLTHRRIILLTIFVIVVNSITAFAIESVQFAFGVVLGGFLSLLNYYWIKWSLKGDFNAAVKYGKLSFLGARHILRYFTFGFILIGIYLTKTASIIALIVGLSAFACAVVVEGIIRIFSSNN